MKNKKLLFIGLVICIFLINFVISIPPFISSSNFVEGYQIKVPPITPFQINEDFNLNFHVFNISNGIPISNSSTSCIIHIYNQTGMQIYEETVLHSQDPTVNNEWEVNIDGGNFSSIGSYAYIIQCNSSSLGGFESVGFDVTLNKNLPEPMSYVLLLIFSISLFIFLVWFNMVFNQQKREMLYKKIVSSYFDHKNNGKNNLGSVILYTLGYGLLKNMIAFYYLVILFFLFVLTEFVIVFQIGSMITLFSTILSVFVWGFILVFIVIIFNFYELFRDILKDIQDSLWGVTK